MRSSGASYFCDQTRGLEREDNVTTDGELVLVAGIVEDVIVRMIPADFRTEDQARSPRVVGHRGDGQAGRQLGDGGVQTTATVVVVEVLSANVGREVRVEL